ncbi:thioredoxin family protein, partial [Carnobacterium sp.]
PKLEKALAKNNQAILYYNTDEGKKTDIKNFEKIVNVTDIQSVPAVLVVKKGQVTNRLSNFKNQNEINQFLLENKS